MSHDARRYLVAIVLLAITAGLGQWLRATRVGGAQYVADFSQVPLQLADFRGQELPVDEATRAYLRPDSMVTRVYEGPIVASLSLIYARDWRQIHNPAGCFPAQGWHIVSDETVVISTSRGVRGVEEINARRLHCTQDNMELLAMFVFAHPGGTTTSWSEYALNVALKHAGAGGLIIIANTPLRPGALERTTESLARLIAEAYPPAVAFWDRPVTGGSAIRTP